MTGPILVIGGGVIGLSVAWELARRGKIVALYERDAIGRATSWSAAGILPPANLDTATDPIDQLRGLSSHWMQRWVDRIQQATGIDAGLRACGGWYLADTAGERAVMLGMADYWSDLNIQCDTVPLASVAQREPALDRWTQTHGDGSAWWVPGEFQIRPPRLLRGLAEACRRSGVELHPNCDVGTLEIADGRCVPAVSGVPIDAETVIVCGGSWSGQIAATVGLQRSLIPIRGQVLLLKTDQPLLHSVVNIGHRYILCRDDGHTIVGSCEEEVGFELGTTESMIESLNQFAIDLVPALGSADRVRTWSGLRPMTFDGFPMIGRVPDTENLYVASGHYRSGIHLSPATAICIADLIEGRDPPINLDAFRVG